MAIQKACKVDGCVSTSRVVRGYCIAHYQSARKAGVIEAVQTKYSTPDEALAARVQRVGDCLEWTGVKNQKGYARMRVNDVLVSVHRHVWEKEHGPIPKGMEVDHECLNRGCVNIEHLRLATRSANTMHRSGAQPNSKSGVRNVHSRHGKWVVRLKTGGKHYEFGTFSTIEEAEPVAIAARKQLFG